VYDAVVVGSGFGGSIAALRLAEAGASVVVLERGRRYPPESFPRDVQDVGELFAPSGLFDVRFFSGLGVVVANGVGGGSLVYANIHIRPDPVVFTDPRWPAGTDRAALEPYYDRVASVLSPSPVPPTVALPKRDAFVAAAARMGRESFDPDQAVDWDACKLVAECEFGCKHGAKKTIDRTYLARAQALGVSVRERSTASYVRPDPEGYAVVYRDAGSGEERTVVGRRVVLSAGTLGTNELLLRSRDVVRSLPLLSARLGHGFSGNGDFLGSVVECDIDLDPAYGPDVTTVMRFFDEAPSFTMAAPTFNGAVMSVLASLGQPSVGWLRPLAPLLWRTLPAAVPFAFRRGLLSRPSRLPAPHRGDPRHMTNLFAIGRDNAGGRVSLRRGGRLDVRWRYPEENRALVARMEAAMSEVAACYGGHFSPIVTWNLFRKILTVHPLGGCALSHTPADGVVSPHGEVHGYPGLFVADGSVVPSSIGFHPVMTISALAERTAEAAAASL
jgi:cholesterol oxidase